MKKLIIALAAVLTFAGCSDFLEPLPNGHYTDKNLLEYPSMIRGFVEKSYDLLPKLYSGGEYVYLDGATDDAVITAQTHAMRRFAVGTGTPASDPFKTFWIRDYRAIMYVNKFLKDRLGINTRYMIDNEQNRRLQRALQGDALRPAGLVPVRPAAQMGRPGGPTGGCWDFPSCSNPSMSSTPTPARSNAPPTNNAWNKS